MNERMKKHYFLKMRKVNKQSHPIVFTKKIYQNKGGVEMGSMYVMNYQVRWCVGTFININLYERSTCRYIRLNALNVLHVPQSRFIAPV